MTDQRLAALHDRYDHIVVGAGASGCVLASRLSEDPGRRVLLIEAGIDLPPGQEPASVRDVYPRSYSEPAFLWPELRAEVAAGSAPRFFEQARLMGGGSSIMGMAALRGLPSDYAAWRSRGLPSWDWDGVLPYFRRLERDLDFDTPAHGRDGPIPVRRHAPADWPPFCAGVDRILRERGFGRVQDLNAEFGDGVGAVPMSNLPQQRVSASMAYLGAEVRRRPNLHVLARASAGSLWTEGARVRGVNVLAGGPARRIEAGETVLCAGAIQTPALLLRSGIGPAAELQALGIATVADLPGVGKGLQNHPMINVAAWLAPQARQPAALRPWPQNCLRFSSGMEGVPAGDMFMVILNKTSWHALGARIASLGVSAYCSYSQGEVTLNSADPLAMPAVRFNLLSDPRDLERMVSAFQLALRTMAAAREAGLVQQIFLPTAGPMIRELNRPRVRSRLKAAAIAALLDAGAAPRRWALQRAGLDPMPALQDTQRARELVQRFAGPVGHVCGTCRMGTAADPLAVTDEQGRVRGLAGLRVADASLMPTIVSANTNLAVTMIAEKVADAIRRTGDTA